MAEVLRNLEQLPVPSTEFIGLQGRFLFNETKYLNLATKDCPLVDENLFEKSIDERNYEAFEKTSQYDRRRYWKDKLPNSTFANQMDAWTTGVVASFTHPDNQARLKRLQPLFQTAGIQIDAFNEAESQKLFNRYFTRPKKEDAGDGVKKFVKDVLTTFNDPTTLHQNLADLEWVTNLFGEKSDVVVRHLIEGEEALRRDPQGFMKKLNEPVEDASRVNNLNTKEKEILSHVWRRGEVLPITGYWDEITEKLKDPNVHKIVISAGTGTGKTTQVPQMIFEALEDGEKFAVTQPRRLPTEELSGRVASELDTALGKEIVYQHGKGRLKSENTKGSFETQGTLLRKILGDPMLLEYNYVMLDEWHERQLDADVSVALLLRAQELRAQAIREGRTHKGKPLKQLTLVIASATVNVPKLVAYLGDNTYPFEIPGKSKNIEEIFAPVGTPPITRETLDTEVPKRIAEINKRMLTEDRKGRNILNFLPGDRLIKKSHKALADLGVPAWAKVEKLYGSLPTEEQKRVIRVRHDESKAIMSSPIAKTSLTIPRSDVVAAGWANLKKVDPETGLEYLLEEPDSKDDLIQERGRTGRESDGTFVFLGTEEEFNNRVQTHPPEIMRSDLTATMLLLKKQELEFSDLKLMPGQEPPPKAVERAKRKLRDLGAIDTSGNLTDDGKKMAEMPVDPNLARMILEAQKNNCVDSVTTIAAMIDAHQLFERYEGQDDAERAAFDAEIERMKQPFRTETSDFLTLLNIWREYEKQPEAQREQWATDHKIQRHIIKAIGEERERILKKIGYTPDAVGTSSETIEKCVFLGFKDMLLKKGGQKRSGRSGRGPLVRLYEMVAEPINNTLSIGRQSGILKDQYENIITVGNYPRQLPDDPIKYLPICQRVQPEWLAA